MRSSLFCVDVMANNEMESRIPEGSQDWMERLRSLNESAIWPRPRQVRGVRGHGIELHSYLDGVPGWGGTARSVTPPICPLATDLRRRSRRLNNRVWQSLSVCRIRTWRHSGDGCRTRRAEVELPQSDSVRQGQGLAHDTNCRKLSFQNGLWLGVRDDFRNWFIRATQSMDADGVRAAAAAPPN